MKRTPSAFILVVASLVASLPSAPGQATPPTPAAPAFTPVKEKEKEVQRPAAPPRSRVLSPEISASIAAGLPKYTPPAPAEKKPETPAADVRETDKPANEILRLPEYVVRDRASPVLRERDVSTPEGMAAIARKRYLSELDGGVLNRWNFLGVQRANSPILATASPSGGATTDRALLMYADEERLKNIKDINDAAGLVSARDKSAGAYIRREALQTYSRTDDFGWKNTTNK